MSFNALEWLEKNMACNYPIADDCSCVATSGAVLPSSFLADLHITTPPTGDANADSRFFISDILRTGDSFQVIVSYMMPNNEAFAFMKSAAIPTSVRAGSPVDSRTFNLLPLSSIPESYSQLRDATGSLIVGTCVDMTESGGYKFHYLYNSAPNTAILSTLITQTLSSFRKVTFINSDGGSFEFTDNFTLQAGDGIEFSTSSTVNPSGTTDVTLTILRVPNQAEQAATYKTAAQVIAAVKAALGNIVTSINGVTPVNGNISLVGGDCVSVNSDEHSLVLSNPCSKPCCSEVDTSDVKDALINLESAKDVLTGLLNSINTQLIGMQARLSSLIAARDS